MPAFDLELDSWPSLEAQVAAIADDIAYDNHDIDDGLRSGILDLDELLELPFVARHWAAIERAPSRASTGHASSRRWSATGSARWSATCSTRRGGGSPRPGSRRSTRCAPPGGRWSAFPTRLRAEERALKRHLYARLYDSAAAEAGPDRGAADRRRPRRCLSRAIRQLLPDGWQRGEGETARLRGIGDYHRRNDRPLRHRPARGADRPGQSAGPVLRPPPYPSRLRSCRMRRTIRGSAPSALRVKSRH